MEDNPLFNAGRGAVFTCEGTIELDASIMDGANLKAGAVACVSQARYPIRLARAIMEHSPHVMLFGPGADAFGRTQNLEQAGLEYFFTERRWKALVEYLTKLGKPVPVRPPRVGGSPAELPLSDQIEPHGTVGAVALDKDGNLAAGTSTGGTVGKWPGRVGDTAVIGAGTYASNNSCAVSATGAGEYFIRLAVARTICALMEYRGMALQDAVDEVIQRQLPILQKSSGGVIAVNRDGKMAWSFNTPGMLRARQTEGEEPLVCVFNGDK